MTTIQMLTTLLGAFIFPFMIRTLWDTFTEKYDLLGGLLAVIFIVGTTWAFNHGMDNAWIVQTGAWVDQGLAAFVGCWVATATKGQSMKKSVSTIVSAIVAGILAGVIGGIVLA